MVGNHPSDHPLNPLGIPDVSWQGFQFMWVKGKQHKAVQICPTQGTITNLDLLVGCLEYKKLHPNGGIS